MYSERLEVRSAVHAGELIRQGAIGKVIQTVNLAPHRMNIPSRPPWFFDKARYGGILMRHRLAPGRSVPLLHQQHEGARGRRADRQRRVPAVSEVRRLRRHGHDRQRRHRLRARRLVHARRPRHLGRRPAVRPRHRGLHRAAQVHQRRHGSRAAITSTSSTRNRRATSTATRCRCPSVRSSCADVVERSALAQDQDQALLAAELVLKAQKIATRPDQRLEGNHESISTAAGRGTACLHHGSARMNPPAPFYVPYRASGIYAHR